ncbi:hypothetical protein AK812_SmicGene12289 [Symbiodinium microadriaticum]|uniref:Uncharacterized protein n=1 Tax=Symbiodinium microadriaticum TaxID=2951 RepID=A0A1Q9EB34_SYMMI|nr:hypothetical protein AK812_SmicGene12289 [Symbiodinium microadriaticum]
MTSIKTWVINLKKHIQQVQNLLDEGKYTKVQLQEMATRWGMPISLITAAAASPSLVHLVFLFTERDQPLQRRSYKNDFAKKVKLKFPKLNNSGYPETSKDTSFRYIGSTNLTVAKREYNRVAKLKTTAATSQHSTPELRYAISSDTKQEYDASRELRSGKHDNETVTLLYRLANHMEQPWRSKARARLRRVLTFRNATLPKYNLPLRIPFLAHNDFKIDAQEFVTKLIRQHRHVLTPYHLPTKTIQEMPHTALNKVLWNHTRKVTTQGRHWKPEPCKCHEFLHEHPRAEYHEGHVATGLETLEFCKGQSNLGAAFTNVGAWNPFFPSKRRLHDQILNQLRGWLKHHLFPNDDRIMENFESFFEVDMERQTPAAVRKHYKKLLDYNKPIPYGYIMMKRKKQWSKGRTIIAYSNTCVGRLLRVAALALQQQTHSQHPVQHDQNQRAAYRRHHTVQLRRLRLHSHWGSIPANLRHLMGNQISPILSTCAIVSTEITWLRLYGQYVASAHLADQLWIRRYVDNRAIIVDKEALHTNPYIWQLASLQFYKKPVQLEDENCDDFLGFRINANNRQALRVKSTLLADAHGLACDMAIQHTEITAYDLLEVMRDLNMLMHLAQVNKVTWVHCSQLLKSTHTDFKIQSNAPWHKRAGRAIDANHQLAPIDIKMYLFNKRIHTWYHHELSYQQYMDLQVRELLLQPQTA